MVTGITVTLLWDLMPYRVIERCLKVYCCVIGFIVIIVSNDCNAFHTSGTEYLTTQHHVPGSFNLQWSCT